MSTDSTLRGGEPFVAVLEVCGFNDWLIRMLRDYRCHQVILIQPDDRKKRKTDRRDAAALSELLWVNPSACCTASPSATVRNAHQTNPHLPGPITGRAAHGCRERHLAKECVGSNRAGKGRRRLAFASVGWPRAAHPA
ncbi:MAG TPA: hypothetical protein VEL76_12790 [Gemmataceae bacterium]|nr:hypothetical protein [Gemmataceae bacterium]